jgi:hypothetical protein
LLQSQQSVEHDTSDSPAFTFTLWAEGNNFWIMSAAYNERKRKNTYDDVRSRIDTIRNRVTAPVRHLTRKVINICD